MQPINPNIHQLLDPATFAATEVECVEPIGPLESFVSIRFQGGGLGGLQLLSHALTPREFLAEWRRIGDQISDAIDETEARPAEVPA